jgi:hypothetical protein
VLAAAAVGKRAAHHLFGAAVVVVPAVVEEGDALVQRGVHDAHGIGRVLDRADVPAAQADNRHLLPGPSQSPRRQAGPRGRLLARQHVVGKRRQCHAGDRLGQKLASRRQAHAILPDRRAVAPSCRRA